MNCAQGTKGREAADVIGNAVRVMRIAAGEEEEGLPVETKRRC